MCRALITPRAAHGAQGAAAPGPCSSPASVFPGAGEPQQFGLRHAAPRLPPFLLTGARASPGNSRRGLTNAIRYGTGAIRLRLIHDSGRLIREVSDSNSTSPHLRHARDNDEGGRGLFIVMQISSRWGSGTAVTARRAHSALECAPAIAQGLHDLRSDGGDVFRPGPVQSPHAEQGDRRHQDHNHQDAAQEGELCFVHLSLPVLARGTRKAPELCSSGAHQVPETTKARRLGGLRVRDTPAPDGSESKATGPSSTRGPPCNARSSDGA